MRMVDAWKEAGIIIAEAVLQLILLNYTRVSRGRADQSAKTCVHRLISHRIPFWPNTAQFYSLFWVIKKRERIWWKPALTWDRPKHWTTHIIITSYAWYLIASWKSTWMNFCNKNCATCEPSFTNSSFPSTLSEHISTDPLLVRAQKQLDHSQSVELLRFYFCEFFWSNVIGSCHRSPFKEL